jgi:ProP effector
MSDAATTRRRPILRLAARPVPAPTPAKPLPVHPNRRQHKAAVAAELLAALRKRFPNAFAAVRAPGPWKPLAIGIRQQISARAPNLAAPPQWRLRQALWRYCSRPEYRAGLVAGAARIDLDGKPAGVVTGSEAAGACERLGTPAKTVLS